jgi:hypothetical protein
MKELQKENIVGLRGSHGSNVESFLAQAFVVQLCTTITSPSRGLTEIYIKIQ